MGSTWELIDTAPTDGRHVILGMADTQCVAEGYFDKDEKNWFGARSAMMNALLGPDDPPIGNPEGKKGHRWGKRKLARDK